MSVPTHPAVIEWLAQTSVAHAFNEADPWIFAGVMSLHLLSLALAFGTSLILNLRLAGMGLRASPAANIANYLQPYMLAAFSLVLLSGLWLFIADVLKFWSNPAFKTKLVLLIVITVAQGWLLHGAKSGAAPARTVAAFTVLTWLAAIIAGRLIGLI
ncbi:hypothetical protein KW842_18420 [Duganella sp. sic0402]|uniref:DUF6644 family protein n=1 Tax=Duganella sp. sic0402 TaxID=2854786 RepID=UPI001C45A84E|nr:DUF6644 family protein [Duganella sp. sic0402]MBV7537747.1 hypothetical protein [Duganella sp. sic0402]